MRRLLFFALSVTVLSHFQWSHAQEQSRSDELSNPDWYGVRIIEALTVPDSISGIIGGSYVELFNMNSPRGGGDVDVSGWQLRTESGYGWLDYTFPQGSVVRAQRYLVVDFSGGTVAAQMLADYDSDVIVAAKSSGELYRDDFFSNGISSGWRDSLALVRADGSIKDFVLYAHTPTILPEGPLLDQALQEGQWRKGHFAPTFGGRDEVGFFRLYPSAADINAAWTQGGRPLWGSGVGSPPGSDHSWFNRTWDHQNQQYVWFRTYEEMQVRGCVVESNGPFASTPIVGATVEIPSLGLYAITDDKGLFTIERVPAGSHDLLIRALGFADSWEPVLHKSPHHSYHVYSQLTPVGPGISVSGIVTPAQGARLVDPLERFMVEIPPGMVTEDTPIQITWIEPGTHPMALNSAALQPRPNGLLPGYVAIGGLYVQPHIPPVAGKEIEVWLLDKDPYVTDKPGQTIYVEGIDSGGTAVVFPEGQFVSHNDKLYAYSRVPHFSSVTNYKVIKLEDGRKMLTAKGPMTTDKDGDGVTDIFDSIPQCIGGMCPGTTGDITVETTLQVSKMREGHWKGAGSIEWGTEGSVFALLIGEGKAQVGGEVGEKKGDSNSRTLTVTLSEHVKYDLPPANPPDEERQCAYVVWQLVEIWADQGNGLFNWCRVHERPMGDPKCAPNIIVAVPAGMEVEREITGHCP